MARPVYSISVDLYDWIYKMEISAINMEVRILRCYHQSCSHNVAKIVLGLFLFVCQLLNHLISSWKCRGIALSDGFENKWLLHSSAQLAI